MNNGIIVSTARYINCLFFLAGGRHVELVGCLEPPEASYKIVGFQQVGFIFLIHDDQTASFLRWYFSSKEIILLSLK
jgi:hypothetical protein